MLLRPTERLGRLFRGRSLLFLFFLLWPIVLVDTSGPSMSDSVLLAAIRLVDHQTWTLSDQTDPKTVFLTVAHDISYYDRRTYSGVGPGASVAAAPLYFVFKPVASLFDESVIRNKRVLSYYRLNSRALNQPIAGHFKDMYLLQILLVWCVVAPLFASFLTRFHRLLTDSGAGWAPATLTVISVGLGSMALYYSSMYSRQALAYLLLWHAIVSLIGRRSEVEQGGTGRSHPSPSRRGCVVAGSLAGAAISIDYPSALLVGIALIFLLPRMDVPRRLLVVAPVLVSVGLTALYHQAAFGSPFTTPYHHCFWYTAGSLAERGLDLSIFQQGPSIGMNAPSLAVMFRLCFGSFKGLFVYSPVLLLALIGHIIGLRERERRYWHVFSLIVFLSYLTFNSTLGTHVAEYGKYFWGGLSVLWGPRYLFAVLPFLAWGLVQLDWQRASVRFWCYGLLGVSCVFNVLGAMFSHVMMSTFAFGPELQFPIAYAFELLLRHGPRVTLLDGYDIHPVLQNVVLLGLAAVSILLLRAFLRPSSIDTSNASSCRRVLPGPSGTAS